MQKKFNKPLLFSFKNPLVFSCCVLLAAAAFATLGTSGALKNTLARFADAESSQGNRFAAGIDSAPPQISDITVAPACYGATITWNTDEPATSMVKWGINPGGPYQEGSDANRVTQHTGVISGLSVGTKYYYKVASGDAWRNFAQSLDNSFNTLGGQPGLQMPQPQAYWASTEDYTDRKLSVKYTLANPGTVPAYGVIVTAQTANNGVTLLSAMPVAVGDMGSGSSTEIMTLKYQIPITATNFETTTAMSARDECSLNYSYTFKHVHQTPLTPPL